MPNFEKVGNKLKHTDTVERTYDISNLKAKKIKLEADLAQVNYLLVQADLLDKPKEGKDGGGS